MILATIICIAAALFAGWAISEARHDRARIRQCNRLAAEARRTRAVITWLGQ